MKGFIGTPVDIFGKYMRVMIKLSELVTGLEVAKPGTPR